jgi:hypothetical protein
LRLLLNYDVLDFITGIEKNGERAAFTASSVTLRARSALHIRPRGRWTAASAVQGEKRLLAPRGGRTIAGFPVAAETAIAPGLISGETRNRKSDRFLPAIALDGFDRILEMALWRSACAPVSAPMANGEISQDSILSPHRAVRMCAAKSNRCSDR